MKPLITTIFLLNFLICVSQNREFKNQGEVEDFWAEETFKDKYKKEAYPKFTGEILKISEHEFKFDNKTLIINCEVAFLPIFMNGIFYPQLVIGNQENFKKLSSEEIEKLSSEEKIIYSFKKNDSFNISNFEELTFLNNSPQIKRFRFWSFKPGLSNPQVYFIELSNDKAKKDTSLEKFIQNAKLTYIKAGHIII